MAELLISNKEHSKGQIVCIKPDGYSWGSRECFPNFIQLSVIGTLDEITNLVNDMSPIIVIEDEHIKGTLILNIDLITPEMLNNGIQKEEMAQLCQQQ